MRSPRLTVAIHHGSNDSDHGSGDAATTRPMTPGARKATLPAFGVNRNVPGPVPENQLYYQFVCQHLTAGPRLGIDGEETIFLSGDFPGFWCVVEVNADSADRQLGAGQ